MFDLKKLKAVLEEKINKCDRVVIIPHNNADFDAIGSAIGISLIAKELNKPYTIIVNDPPHIIESGVKKIIDECKDNYEILKKDKFLKAQSNKSNPLFILCDVNKANLICVNDILPDKEDVIVIDHHNSDKNTVNSDHIFIDCEKSSASEIITELLQSMKINIPSDAANYLYAGIYLDTAKLTKNCKANTMNMAAKLLEAGADPNYTDPFDTDYTALRTAKDYPEIIELLKQAEANETKTQTANLPKQEEFDAALIEASRVGNYEEVKKLLAAGANVNITDGQETTPLWMASSNNHVQIVELLLGAGAKESIERASKRGYRGREDPQGTTPLWEASFRNHPEIVQLLLAAGARDAIYIASMRGDIEAVKFFIDEGVDVNEKDEMNDTALIWAAQRGYTEIVKLLLAAGADISVLEYRGDTPLIYAITEGHIEIVKLLLKAGADVNQRGFLLVTPLMRAAERGQEKVVKLLLQAGADVNKREDSGKTALQLAQEAGNEKIVKLLKQAGAKE